MFKFLKIAEIKVYWKTSWKDVNLKLGFLKMEQQINIKVTSVFSNNPDNTQK
jgi:hypothetical protein